MRSFTTFILLCILSLPIIARSIAYQRGDKGGDDDDDDKCVVTRPPRKEKLGRGYPFTGQDDRNAYDPTDSPQTNFYWWTSAQELRANKGNPERADQHGIVYLIEGDHVRIHDMKFVNGDLFPYSADHILELQIIAAALNRYANAMDKSYIETIKYIANGVDNLVNLEDVLNKEKGAWTEAGGGGRVSKPLHDYLQRVKVIGGDVAWDIDEYLVQFKGFTVIDNYGPVEREWRAYLRTIGIKYSRCFT